MHSKISGDCVEDNDSVTINVQYRANIAYTDCDEIMKTVQDT